jgi:hypothetical protein
MSERNNGQTGRSSSVNGNGQADMFCRTVIAAVAAMLALKLCRIIRHWLQG